MKSRINDFLVTAGILVVSFLFGIVTNSMFQTDALVPMVFVLAVFLTSVITKGYLCGIIASMVSTLAVNFAFTFPYFEFNFTIPENLFSAVVMLVVAIVTGALTTKIKQTEKIKADSEREKMRANLLRAGKCSVEYGFVLDDLLTSYERIADHCSNMAVEMLQSAEDKLEVHEYLNAATSPTNWVWVTG